MSVSLRLLNILYTNDMKASVEFYETLGLFREEDGEVNDWWNAFPIGNASLALHWNDGKPLPTESNPEIHLQASKQEFELIHSAISSHHPSSIEMMEGVGRYFTVVDPNGVRVQVNEES